MTKIIFIKKEVDWSLLHRGFSIPITIQVIFQKAIEEFLPRGQSKDILQLRYNTQSEIAEKFRNIFLDSYNYF